ncbi:MAG TPA: polymer-forming cytoskeletal protein [Terriglobia bacterium]|nr:polymer-forming cytoskeletal protein [Terriglobia bacterium]
MWKNPNPTATPSTSGKPNSEIEKSTPMTTPSTSTVNTSSTITSEPSPVSAARNSIVNSNEQATIGKSLIIKGEVTGSEALYIDGRVEGSINLAGNRVTIGRNGVVSANVVAREIVIIGKVRGNLNASDRVDIRNEGSLTGDVIAQRISIEDGAFFKGGIDIQKPNSSQQQKVNGKSDSTSVTGSSSASIGATA